MRIAPRAVALACLVQVALASCGVAEPSVRSAVARDRARYSEDERLAEIDRLDRIIAGETSEMGFSRALPAEDTTIHTKPTDGTVVIVDESKPVPHTSPGP